MLQVVVNISECSGQVRSDDNIIDEGEGAVMDLSLDSLEDLLLEGQIEEVEDHTLVLSEEFTATSRSQS